jgi:Ras-specific guanine nucleotide-releasing factor 2
MKLNNFSSCVALLAGLAMSPIYRLTLSHSHWRATYPREAAALAEIETIVSSQCNWAGLRKELHNITPPAVPYLGIYTSDLTFGDQGNPSRLDDNLINWDKCRLGTQLACYSLLFLFLFVLQKPESFGM